MKKVILFVVGLSLLLGSCTKNTMTVEGVVDKDTYNGKSVYLYVITSDDFNEPKLLTTATIENKAFTFEGLEENSLMQGESKIPSIAIISFFDLGDEALISSEDNNMPVATFVLEKGGVKLGFTDGSVSLSGTPMNESFNKIHATITDFVALAEKSVEANGVDNVAADAAGKDGRAQFEEIDKQLRTQTYDFVKGNMANNAGQFIFLKSYVDNLFTPAQIRELIGLSTDQFRARTDIQTMKSILDQMDAGTLNFSGDIDESALME